MAPCLDLDGFVDFGGSALAFREGEGRLTLAFFGAVVLEHAPAPVAPPQLALRTLRIDARIGIWQNGIARPASAMHPVMEGF